MRLYISAVLGLVVVFALACGSCGDEEEQCLPSITIVSPDDGALIKLEDDEAPDRDGLQISVRAEVSSCLADSSTASLVVNKDSNKAYDALVMEGGVFFENVTVAPIGASDEATLTASVRNEETGRIASQTITVTIERPPLEQCAFVSPVHGSVLGVEDDLLPERLGIQHDVVIQCPNDLNGSPANLTVDGTPVPTAVFVGNSVVFPTVHFSEGENILIGSVNMESGLWTGQISVTVDTPDCEVRIIPSGPVVFNLDGDEPRVPGRVAIADAGDGSAGGIEADFVMPATDCGGGRAVLMVDGEESAHAIVQEGEDVEFDRVVLPDAPNVEVFVRVTPVNGEFPRGRSVTQSFWVDSIRPAPVVLFPSGGEIIRGDLDKDDDLDNGVQIDLYLESPGLESFEDPPYQEWGAALIEAFLTRVDTGADGRVVTYSCVVGRDNCRDPDNADRYRIELDLELEADYELNVMITDPAGNIGIEDTIAFSVDASPVNVEIVSPEADQVVNLDFEGVVDGRVPVLVRSGAAEAIGAEVRVSCSGFPTATGIMGADGTSTLMVDFSELPCEGSVAQCVARVTIDDASFESEQLSFVADLEPPVLEIVAPYEGELVYDAEVLLEVITSCLEDDQTVVIMDGSGEVVGSGTSLGGGALILAEFVGGEHTIFASSADAAGNPGISGEVSFRVAGDVPLVSFVAPADGDTLVAGDDLDSERNGVQYDVIVEVENEPEGTPVTLEIGYDDDGEMIWGASVGLAHTDAEQKATFEGVTLPEGEFGLRAIAMNADGMRGEAIVSVSVDTGVATCRVVSPADGSSIGPAHDPDATAETGVTHAVRVRTDLADGESVELILTDGRGDDRSESVAVVDGQAIFDSVVFTTEEDAAFGTNYLDANCGDDGIALQTVVHVDFDPPVASIVMPLDGQVFNAASTDTSAQPGFHIHFRAEALDSADGESVLPGAEGVLTVSCDGHEPEEYHLVFQTYGPYVQARARPMLEDEATCELSFTVVDPAGNVSDPSVVSVVVDRVPPEVEILYPADGRWFGIIDDRQEFEPGFQQNVQVAYSGVEDGQPVRLLFRRTSEGGVDVEAEEVLVGSGRRSGYTFQDATYTMEAQDEVQVRVVAQDAAGNTTVASVWVNINTVAPQVAITRPVDGRRCFNLLEDFNMIEPGVHTQVNVETVGVADGLPLTLCGTNRDDGGEACDLAGFTRIENRPVTSSLALFSAVRFMDGEQELIAEVRDLAGNFSRSEPVVVCADSIPPRVTTFVVVTDQNDDGYVNASELLDTDGEVCFYLQVEGADGQDLEIRTSNPSAGTRVATGVVSEDGVVSLCGTLAEGSHALEAHVRDENRNPNLWPANPVIENPEALRTLVVDTIPPSLAITSPPMVVNAAVAGGENIDPEVEFAISSGAEGGLVTFEVDGIGVGQTTVSGGSASMMVSLTNGQEHELRALVADAAGNLTDRSRTVMVDTTPPEVTIQSPVDGAKVDSNTFSMTASVIGAEVGEDLHVYRLDGANEVLLREDSVSATQPQSFNVSLSDGEATLFARAWDSAGNVGESAHVTIEVETEGCSLVWQSPSTSPRRFNIEDDEEPSTDGLQTTIVAYTVDCAGSDVELLKNSSQVQTQTASASGLASFQINLDDGEVGSFTARMDDNGIITEATFEFSVDISRPVLERIYPAGEISGIAYVTNENPSVGEEIDGYLRLGAEEVGGSAMVNMVFEAGDANGGSFRLLLNDSAIFGPVSITADAQSVEIDGLLIPQKTEGLLEARLTDIAGNSTSIAHDLKVDVVAPAAPVVSLSIVDNRRATLEVAWSAVGDDGLVGVLDEIEVRWATSEITGESTYESANVGALLAGDSLSETLSPLPPLNTYWVSVRAMDELGNRSPLVPGVNLVELENMWNELVLEGDDGGLFGFTMVPHGVDLNNDGYDDIIVGAYRENADGTDRGAVYVYYGGSEPEELRRQKLVGVQNGELFGVGLAAGDVTGDGLSELLVGSEGFQSNRGRALLYFLQTATDELDENFALEFRGRVGTTGAFGRPVSIIGDINGNGINDLAISARGEDNVGYLYVFFGRPKHEWNELVGDDGYVSVSSADLVIAGTEQGGMFGYWKGIVSIGVIGDDEGESFIVPAMSASKVYVFRSSEILAASHDTLLASDAYQVIQGTGLFGFDAAIAHSSSGDTHLAVGSLNPHSVRLYSMDEYGVNEDEPVQKLQGTGNYGFSLSAGDITGDGYFDLLVGTNDASLSSAYLYVATGSIPPYSPAPDSQLKRAGHLGASVWIGDLNGDGILDIAAGSPGSGRVYVWH